MQSSSSDISAEVWTNPLSALIAINNSLSAENAHDACQRSVNFMSYELSTNCADQTEDETFARLNDFFFNCKKFRVISEPFLLRTVLHERCGAGITLSLIYMHLGQTLGLKLQIVHWPLHTILKWECGSKSRYVDISQMGKILSEEELLLVINKHKEQVRTLTLSESLVQYLSYIALFYRQSRENEPLHQALNLILSVDPENTRVLAERAMLRKEMGLLKESLHDFKRYFAFTDQTSVSPEICSVYEELKQLTPPVY